MSEKFKVLSAILALEEFTPEEVSRFSGVKITTVRSVLSRNSELYESAGQIETGRRGGQPTRHRLTPEGRTKAHAQLQEAFSGITPAAGGVRTSFEQIGLRGGASFTGLVASKAFKTPFGLAAATDTLGRLSLAKTKDERIELLKLAETQVRSALEETPSTEDDVTRTRQLVLEKLQEIRLRRAHLHEQHDVAVLNSLHAGTASKLLRRFAKFTLTGSQPHSAPAQPRLQIWTAKPGVTGTAALNIAQALQTRAELLVSDVPTDATQSAEVGDVVLLVVNSQTPDATEQFRKAAAACSAAGKPLVVLDQTYSPAFRNMVLSTGNTDYRDHVAALDSDGIFNIVAHATRGLRPSRRTHFATAWAAPNLRTRDDS